MRGQSVIYEGSDGWGIRRNVEQSSFVIGNISTWGEGRRRKR